MAQLIVVIFSPVQTIISSINSDDSSSNAIILPVIFLTGGFWINPSSILTNGEDLRLRKT